MEAQPKDQLRQQLLPAKRQRKYIGTKHSNLLHDSTMGKRTRYLIKDWLKFLHHASPHPTDTTKGKSKRRTKVLQIQKELKTWRLHPSLFQPRGLE